MTPQGAFHDASAGPGIGRDKLGASLRSRVSLLVVRRVEVVPADIFALEGLAHPDPYASAVILREEDDAGGLERGAHFVERFLGEVTGRTGLELVDTGY